VITCAIGSVLLVISSWLSFFLLEAVIIVVRDVTNFGFEKYLCYFSRQGFNCKSFRQAKNLTYGNHFRKNLKTLQENGYPY